MSAAYPQLLPIAKVLGLTSCTALTTYIASFSVATVPALRAAPVSTVDIAKQWNFAFELGKSTAPPFAITCASCFAYLAYCSRNVKSTLPVTPFMLYTAAAVLAPSIVPYTLTVMSPTIAAIVAKAKGKDNAPSDSETKALLEKWRGQNITRACITGSAAVLSAVAMFI